MDSDDFYRNDRLEKLYCFAQENNADYVGCGYSEVLDLEGSEEITEGNIANEECSCGKEMLVNRALVNPLLSFYQRDLLINNKVKFTEGFIYEDTAFWAKAVPFIKKPCFCEESLAFHTIHENSTMTTISAKRVRNIFPVIDDILEFYKEKKQYLLFKNELDYFCVRILLCSSIERISRVIEHSERTKLVRETFEFLKNRFPAFRKNPYLNKGKINFYIRHSNKFVCNLLILYLRLKNKE